MSIPDNTTNDFIVPMLVQGRSWIGLSKVSDEWRWTDGKKASYTNWLQNPPQPSGDGSFVEMLKNYDGKRENYDGKWNDLSRDPSGYKPHGYVCQYDPYGKFVVFHEESFLFLALTKV